MEESKDMEDYPFRQEIEDLVKSPLRTTQVEELLEEGEIVVPHSPPSTPFNPIIKMAMEKMP